MKKIFSVKFTKKAVDFIETMPEKAKSKLFKKLDMVEAGCIDNKMFKKLKGHDLWEIRILYSIKSYRFLAYWDKAKESIMIITHGFVKKTNKIPLSEIKKAEQYIRQHIK